MTEESGRASVVLLVDDDDFTRAWPVLCGRGCESYGRGLRDEAMQLAAKSSLTMRAGS